MAREVEEGTFGMNQEQFLGMLRAVLPAGLAYVVGKGWIPAGAAADVGAAVLTVAAAGYSYYTHTDSNKIAAVEALPDVQKIIVSAAPGTAASLAVADPSRPKVATQ